MIAVQEYKFKRGFKQEAHQRIREALKACFDVEFKEREDEFVLSYGALRKMTVRVSDKLIVETESTTGVPDKLITDTNTRFRCFLERATGYTAKQRAKKAQEATKRS